jgi:hypothetical protein
VEAVSTPERVVGTIDEPSIARTAQMNDGAISRESQPRSWKRRTATFFSVFVLLLIGYPFSIGPACWTMARINPITHPTPGMSVNVIYQPVAEAIILGPDWLREIANRWIALGLPGDVQLETDLKDGIVWSGPGYSYTLLYLKLGRDK